MRKRKIERKIVLGDKVKCIVSGFTGITVLPPGGSSHLGHPMRGY